MLPHLPQTVTLLHQQLLMFRPAECRYLVVSVLSTTPLSTQAVKHSIPVLLHLLAGNITLHLVRIHTPQTPSMVTDHLKGHLKDHHLKDHHRDLHHHPTVIPMADHSCINDHLDLPVAAALDLLVAGIPATLDSFPAAMVHPEAMGAAVETTHHLLHRTHLRLMTSVLSLNRTSRPSRT